MNLPPHSVQVLGCYICREVESKGSWVPSEGAHCALLSTWRVWAVFPWTPAAWIGPSKFAERYFICWLTPKTTQEPVSSQGAGLVTRVWRHAVLFQLSLFSFPIEPQKKRWQTRVFTLKSQCSQRSRIKYWTNKLWHSAGRKDVWSDGTTCWAMGNLLEVNSFMLLQSRRLLS